MTFGNLAQSSTSLGIKIFSRDDDKREYPFSFEIDFVEHSVGNARIMKFVLTETAKFLFKQFACQWIFR